MEAYYSSGRQATNATVRGNFIGTDANGQSSGLGNTQRGISLDRTNNVLIASNLISGNTGNVQASADSKTTLQGNSIGTNATGTSALGNPQNGVVFINGSSEFTVGGTSAGQGNIISGNQHGILISAGGALGGSVLGNTIGTNASGTAALANAKLGILVENSPAVTIGGATTASRNLVSGNGLGGIAFIGSLTNSGTVSGNYIGTDSAGTAAIGNASFGVLVGSGSRISETDAGDARNITIGGSETGRRNLFSGNSGPGIWIAGADAREMTISGNYIGTDKLGLASIPNTVGVLLSNGARSNTIQNNLVSGNTTSGIRLTDAETNSNLLIGNWIGINASGGVALANSTYGIEIINGAAYNTLLNNVVSGNVLGGIFIGSGGSNTLRGNLIGTDATGTRPLGNGTVSVPRMGILLSSTTSNLIGSSLLSERNVISGNNGDGVVLSGTSYGNTIKGNSIGSDRDGVGVISNSANGILLDGDTVTSNTIGGSTATDGNLIYCNQISGLRLPGLTSSTTSDNTFNNNTFRGNLVLGIDVGAAGPTLNDDGDLDGLPNAPVIVSALISSAGNLVITGYSRPGRTLQFYASSSSSNGRGQGNRRLASLVEGTADDLDTRTDGKYDNEIGQDDPVNFFRFEIPIGSPAIIETGDLITAVAVGSTSEFGNYTIVGNPASNNPAEISLSNTLVTLKSGDTLNLNGSFTDYDSTRWNGTVDYGDGSPLEVLALSPQQTFTLSHLYSKASPANAPYVVKVTIVDNGGKESTATFNVSVVNQAPVISANDIVFTKTVNEAGVVTVAGSFTDSSNAETHTVEISWGDGSSSIQNLAAGVYSFSLSHPYADDGVSRTPSDPYSLGIVVRDEGGLAASPSGVFITNVTNVRPSTIAVSNGGLTLDADGNPVVNEGTPFTLTGSFGDPGLKDSHEVSIDWGDGTPIDVISIPSVVGQTSTRTFTASHVYANNPAAPNTTFTATFSVVDDDEPTTPVTVAKTIKVLNSVPVISGLTLANAIINENGVASLRINYSDAGVLDTQRVFVNWGDGSQPESYQTSPGLTELTVTHRYLNNKRPTLLDLDPDYTISVKMADNDMPDNVFVTATTKLSVLNTAPVVTSSAKLEIRDAVGGWVDINTLPLADRKINEGDDVRVSGSFTDASESDTHTVTIVWSNTRDSANNLRSTQAVVTQDLLNRQLRSYSAVYKYLDDYATGTPFDTESIQLTITDDDNASASPSGGELTRTLLVNNVAPVAMFVPDELPSGDSGPSPDAQNFYKFIARVSDPGTDTFNYRWRTWLSQNPSLIIQDENNVGNAFSVNRGLYGAGGTIVIELTVTDDDTGASNPYVSTLLVLDDTANDVVTIQDADFASNDNLTVLSLGGDDTITAIAVSPDKNVVLDGGAGKDLLFGGRGNDTLILHNGDDEGTDTSGGDDVFILLPNSTLKVTDNSGRNTLDFSRSNVSTTGFASLGITFDLGLTAAGVAQDVAPQLGRNPESGPRPHVVQATGSFAALVGSSYNDALKGPGSSTISAGAGQDVIVVQDGSGTIDKPGKFSGGADADEFRISGTTVGNIDFSGDSGMDVFNISNTTLTGIDFSGGADADVFNLTGAITTVGQIDFNGDSGMDVLNIGGTIIGSIDFGGGADADELNLRTGGSIGGIDFSGDSGVDVLNIDGAVAGKIDFGGGADVDVLNLNFGGSVGSIDFSGDSGMDVLNISGRVAGGIDFGGGADKDELNLSASAIVGQIDLSGDQETRYEQLALKFQGDSGVDVLTLSGTVYGRIDFGGGADADVVNLNYGSSVVGNIDFTGDSGMDVLTLNGTVAGKIDFGGGADADVLNLGGRVGSIDFRGDSGMDVLTITGTVVGKIDFGGGADADVLNLGGAVGSIDFKGDSGMDVLTITGTVAGKIDFGGGADADVVNLGTNGSIGSIDFNGDSGMDVLTIGGTVAGRIDFGGGADADTLRITERGYTGNVVHFIGGDDADVLSLSFGGNVGSIDFNGDSGMDVLTISGRVGGGIDFGGGADADVLNLGTSGSVGSIDFSGDSGMDVLTISGRVAGGIDFGGGADADVLTITGTAVGSIDFSGDAGDDFFFHRGTSGALVFNGGEGADTLRNDASNVPSIQYFGFYDPARDPSKVPTGSLASNDLKDLFVNNGSSIGSLAFYGGAGEDVLVSKGDSIGQVSFQGDSGADVLILSGVGIGRIDFGGGADADVLSLSGSRFGNIDFSGDSDNTQSANDTFINNATGILASDGTPTSVVRFNGLSGNDTFRNDAGSWSQVIFDAGQGNDQYQNNASGLGLVAFNGSEGNDIFENNGNDVSNVVFVGATGDDSFMNKGNNTKGILIFGGEGNDQFVNIGADVDGVQFIDESGANTLSNFGARVKNVTFQGGSGVDTMANAGTSTSSFVFYGNGGADRWINDTAAIGSNNLRFLATGSISSANWPSSVTAPFSLPSIPTPSPDNAGDLFVNRAASVSTIEFHGDAGDDFFQNSGSLLTNTTINGGVGDDKIKNTSDGASLKSFIFNGDAGDDAFQNDAANADGVTFHGGDGNDSTYQNGDLFGTITFNAGDGSNILVNWGKSGQILRMISGTGSDRFQNNADEIELLEFAGGDGLNGLQNNGNYIKKIVMVGGADTDTLLNGGNAVTFIDMVGGAGSDSVVNVGADVGNKATAGTPLTGIRFVGGDGYDVLRTQGSGLSNLVFDGGSDNDSLVYSTTSGGAIAYTGGAGDDGFVFSGNASSIDVQLDAGNDSVAYSGDVPSSTATVPTVRIAGGDGDDAYKFTGTPTGYVQFQELYSGATDLSQDSLDFASYLGGALSLDLASSSKQEQRSGFWLQFAADSSMGLENVTGSQFGDIIRGNDRPNILRGADYSSGFSSSGSEASSSEVQWVLLDFATYTNDATDNANKVDEFDYSKKLNENESTTYQDLVIQGLKKAYYGTNADGTVREYNDLGRWFNVKFTTNKAEIDADTTFSIGGGTAVNYATIYFNRTPETGQPGGYSSEIDPGNINLGGEAVVQVHGLLGGTINPPPLSVDGSNINGDFLRNSDDEVPTYGQRNPDNTPENFVKLSTKIAAHELGHLLGLRHYDSFGPIGSGVHTPPGVSEFNPTYTGPAEAYETFQHLISSPASVGSNRKNDLGNLYFGEREAVKLAYATSGANANRITESSNAKGIPKDAQEVSWTALTVPRTVSTGISANQSLFAEVFNVSGAIGLNSLGKSEDDFYKFAGGKGDIVTIEVSSFVLSRYTNSNPDGSFNVDGFIDSTVTLYENISEEPANIILAPVQYYKSIAYNDDEFESPSTDSILIDLILPKTGSYWLKVDSFTRAALSTDPNPSSLDEISQKMYLDKINDTDIGNYELFVYRFKRANASDTTNTMQGRGGFDVIQGTTGEDYNIYLAANAIPTNATSTEVTPLVVTIPFIDPAGGYCTAEVIYGDGSVETIENFTAATGLRISHTFPDDGIYTVNFVLSNDDGKSVSGSFIVTVTDAAPTATWLSTGNLEGGNTTLTVTGIDSVGDTPSLRYVITPTQLVRDEAIYGTSTTTNTYTELFNDNTSKTLYIRVMDKDGLVKDYTTTLVIANVVPSGTILNNGPITEGSSATVSITGATDVSSVDVAAGLRYLFSTSQDSWPTTNPYATASSSNSANFTFTDNGSYTVYGRVYDRDNGYSEYSTVVLVNNVAPTVSIASITNPAVENLPVTITANGSDPAGVADPLTYDFTVVRLSDSVTVSSGSGSSRTHTWIPTTTGNYSVTVSASDDDGGESSIMSQTFEVLPPLTLWVGLPADGFKGVPGQTRTYTLNAGPTGNGDNFTYVIDWKDGTAVQTITGTGSTTVDHVYPNAGSYAPTVSVTNSLGRTVSTTLSAIAINAWELQGTTLAIGASDGGSDDDTLTLDALSIAGQFSFGINSAAAVNVTTNGSIRIFGGSGTDRLIVRGNGSSETIRIDNTTVVYNTSYTIAWDSMETRDVQSGAGNDSIDVVDGAIVTIDGGAGTDTVRAIGGTAANTWTITAANAGNVKVGSEASARFTFVNAESAVGSDAVVDTFVFNAGSSLGGSLAGGSGAWLDVLNTSALAGSVNLATGTATGLVGTLTGIESFVSNGGTLTGPNVATTWALTGNRIGTLAYTHTVVFSHSYSGFAVLQGGSGNDTFNIGDGGSRTTVQGGTGTDSLIGQNLQTTWEITEIGGGSFGTLMQFKQIENLTGGNNIDRFRIRSTASIPGVLDGGLGDNILDYSLFTTAVVVDLQAATPSSTNVSSLTKTFPIIMGGSGNDTLKGSRTRSSVIVGGAGIDSILGGDLGDILVGGLGADSLRGGLGEDILVGGRITFDTDVVGLRSIFLEWTRSDRTVDQRFVNLTNNTSSGGTLTSPINGNFFLRGGEDPNARTLLDDSVVDELFGGVESDWFVISASELANPAKHDRTALDKRRTPVAAGW